MVPNSSTTKEIVNKKIGKRNPTRNLSSKFRARDTKFTTTRSMKWRTRTVPISNKDLSQLNKLWALNMPFLRINRHLIRTTITMAISKLGPSLALSPTLRDKKWSRAPICPLKFSHQLTKESHLNRIRPRWELIIQFSAEPRLVSILRKKKAPQTLATTMSVPWVTNSQLLRSATGKKRPHQVWKRLRRCRPRPNLALM